uniref:Uncharacterized protein n=1 Tax=Arundo donax TaxID=35708 RepID=A0A0A8YBW8_ARUDO
MSNNTIVFELVSYTNLVILEWSATAYRTIPTMISEIEEKFV